MINFIKTRWISILAHVGSLIPLAVMIYDYVTDNLTVNPIQEAEIRTGHTALVLLILSLACTPLNTVFGFKPALRVKRALGLYGFLYVCLHFAIFTFVDYAVDLQLIWQQIIEKPYILIGFAAFILLIPLAITSTKGWQKRLGKDWRLLHNLVFLIVPMGIAHFALDVKALVARPEPVLWGVLVALLLMVRLPAVRKWTTQTRLKLLPAVQGSSTTPQRRGPSPTPTRSPVNKAD